MRNGVLANSCANNGMTSRADRLGAARDRVLRKIRGADARLGAMADRSDLLRRAFHRLQAVRSAVQGQEHNPYIHEKYVSEYHAGLAELADAGFDVATFRIPDEQLFTYSYQRNYVTGERWTDDHRSVDRPFLLMKLDAVLGYFTSAAEPTPRPIGFQPPED
jgi:hypothetical protein